MGNNIINIADLLESRNQSNNNSKKELTASELKTKMSDAKKIILEEIRSLEKNVDQFCDNVEKKYAIANVMKVGDMMRQHFYSIYESYIMPLVEKNEVLREEIGTAEYNKIRKAFYNDIIAEIDHRKENNI